MKKTMIFAIVLGMITLSSCNEKKAPQTQEVVPTTITDSTFQASAAGNYKSYDGKKVITINSDFSVHTENLDKEYYKWAFLTDPKGTTAASISLIRKGLDADVEDQATIDTSEGTLLIKNETFRKEEKK